MQPLQQPEMMRRPTASSLSRCLPRPCRNRSVTDASTYCTYLDGTCGLDFGAASLTSQLVAAGVIEAAVSFCANPIGTEERRHRCSTSCGGGAVQRGRGGDTPSTVVAHAACCGRTLANMAMRLAW